jgi:hypothetical protein
MRAFSAELRALQILEPLQGHMVPKLVGDYHVEFAGRELPDDRSVSVRVLEDYFGNELDRALVAEFSGSKKKYVREQASRIVERMYQGKVFLPDIESWNFIIGEGDVPAVILTGLEASFDPKVHAETAEDTESSVRNAIRRVEGMLEELGLNL